MSFSHLFGGTYTHQVPLPFLRLGGPKLCWHSWGLGRSSGLSAWKGQPCESTTCPWQEAPRGSLPSRKGRREVCRTVGRTALAGKKSTVVHEEEKEGEGRGWMMQTSMADIHDRPPAGAGAGAVPHPPKGAKMSLHSPKERRTPSSGMGAVETVVKGKSSSDAANGSRAAGSDAGVNDVCDSPHEGISLSMGRRTVFPPVPSRSSASSTATSSNPSSSIRGKVPSLHFSPHRTASNGGSKSSARWGDTPRGDWSEASESLSSGAFLTGTRFEEEEEEEEGDCEEEARRLPDITTATPRGGDDSAVKNVAGGAPTAERGVGGQQLGENDDDEGHSESGDLVSPLRKMEPNRDVTRRYFFGNTPEKPLAFLRYFDVHVPKTERFEKIVGGKVESEQNDLMRYYYSEFLAAPPFESSLPLDKRRMDVEDLQEFVDTVNPKTRVDAFPLYVLLKDLVKRIVTKQMELFSREISQSRCRSLNPEP